MRFGDTVDYSGLQTVDLVEAQVSRIAACSSDARDPVSGRGQNQGRCSTRVQQLDRYAGQSNAGQEVEAPAAVGFCTYFKRDCLRKVGYFDEELFGKGYGEEIDFCQRAIQAGLRNVLCDDAYVVHHGNASFGPLGLKPNENSMLRLLAKHPKYQQEVMEFIQSDPLSSRRQQILDCLERADPKYNL